MKIGIDLSPLRSDPKRRGISNYVYNLVKALVKIDKINEYYFFNSKDVDLEFLGDNFSKDRIINGEITSDMSNNIDLFVITNYLDFNKNVVNQRNLACKTTGIVYDLIPVIFWDRYLGGIEREYFKRLSKIYDSDRILTISESAKKDISELLDISVDKIDVVYAGFEECSTRAESLTPFNEIKRIYNLKEKYIFSVPSMDYRKNIHGLIDAYCLLPDNIKGTYQLVITNEMTQEFEKHLREFVSSRNISNSNVVITNYVDHETLRLLYKNASIFVFPSFYEGFGLPVLEAMSYGLPVITSNISSLPEVVEDAGILINPYDAKEISKAMYEILTNNDLRIDLSKKGIIQAKKFTWELTALLSLKSFQRAVIEMEDLKLGIVTTWNVKCGIAEYTKYLLEELPDLNVTILANFVDSREITSADGSNVVRCWKNYEDNLDKLYDEIISRNLNIIHIQFNFGLFNLKHLSVLIDKLRTKNIRTLITFHSTQDVVIGNEVITLKTTVNSLKLVDKIVIHTKSDFDHLNKLGLSNNVVLLPQGYHLFEDEDKTNVRRGLGLYNSIIVSNFGFLLPHKGVLETIIAVSILKEKYHDIMLIILSSTYQGNVSLEYLNDCKREIIRLNLSKNVIFLTDYLEEAEIIELLHACDVVVLPYKETKESSSASVRFALASCRPTIVTDQPIFDEFYDEVYKIAKCRPDIISSGIRDIINDQQLSNELVDASKRRCDAESWGTIAKHYYTIIERLNSKTLYADNATDLVTCKELEGDNVI